MFNIGKILNRQRDNNRKTANRDYRQEIEDTQFDYSELPLEELEEELQMYNEDIKKLRKAIADKKKESEAVASPKAVVKVKKPSRVPKELSNN